MADYAQLTKRLLALGGMYGTEGAGRPPGGGTGESVRLYHGTGYGAGDFLGPQIGQAKFRIPSPSETNEPGFFMTPSPEVAARYGGYSQHNLYGSNAAVVPLDVNLKNVATLDWKKVQDKYGLENDLYHSRYVGSAINAARKNGKDFLVIKNMEDVGGKADQIIALAPSGKVKNAITGETMLGALLALGLGSDRKEPLPPH